MLPVPANAPLLPPALYSTQPPYIPSVPFHPHVEGYRGLIAIQVANEAGMKATTNPARMFVYNLLCSNGWNNQQFAEICKLVSDAVMLIITKQGPNSQANIVKEAAEKVLTLFSSYVVMAYQDLQGLVPPGVFQAAAINAPQLDELKREIAAMYNHNNSNQMGMMMPGMMAGGMSMGMPMYPNGMPMQAPMQMHPHAHLMGGHPPQHAQPAQMHSGQMFGGHHSGVAISHSDNGEDDRYNRRARGETQQAQPVEIPQQQQQVASQPERVKEVVNKELTIQEGSEMDRAKHQVVYFGQNGFTQKLNDRYERLAASTRELETSSLHDKNSPVLGGWMFYPSMEEAVNTGQLIQMQNKEFTGVDQLLRRFVVTASPIIIGAGMVDYWDKIRSCMTFAGMARQINIFSQALEESKEDQDKDQLQATIDFLQTIDNRMTQLLNRFLRVSLNLEGVWLDSFTEDVPELKEYLGKHFGKREVRALENYESELHDAINHEVGPDAKEAMASYFNLDPNKEFPLFLETYSFTHVFLNSRELGWRTNERPLIINKETTPALFSIVESLSKHKKEMESPTVHDILVSSDSQVYHLFRDYRQPDVYMISQIMN